MDRVTDDVRSVRSEGRRRVLDPVSRASEILFGLIMVLTFTLSLAATEASRADVRAVLLGLLGCNFAWAIIDAVMYLMGTRGERLLELSTVASIRRSRDPAVGRSVVADHLPPAIVPALTEADLERIRLHLAGLPPESFAIRFNRDDYLAAGGVFLLVFVSLFPVAAPFLFIDDVAVALRLSNVVAILLLFLAGFAFGRQVGRPWRSAVMMVAIGVVLVAVAMAFGG